MIFFDNNATTPLLPEVVQVMLTELDGIPRNPSSITSYGREGRTRIALARRMIADLFGVTPEEIIFTSGATESNHFLINGFSSYRPDPIVTTKIEHSCAQEPLEHLACQKKFVTVGSYGAALPQDIERAITPGTAFLFLTGANNETGVMIDLDAICEIARAHQIPLVIDGVVLLGRTNLFPLPKEIAAISFSGHKIHGPKGSGIAIVRKKYPIPPLFRGGHQEHNMRAGTENTPAILGFAKAIELIDKGQFAHMKMLRDSFEKLLCEEKVEFEVNGEGPRVPNTSCLYFKEKDAELLTIKLDSMGLIASVGSACSAGTVHTSRVLREMGYDKKRLYGSMRFSFSRLNTLAEVKSAVQLIKEALN